MPGHPALSLEDCLKIQEEFKNGVSVVALSKRFGKSTPVIYKILNGNYRTLRAARQAEQIAKQQAAPDGIPICSGCGLSTAVPCPICAARETVKDVDVTA